jgi:uncharacterized protein YndB with AHSA1/START domain
MSQDIDLTAQIRIARPAEALWSLVADYGCDARWRTGVQSMVPTPSGRVRPGTTSDEQLRFGGKTYRNLGEVLTVEDGVRFTWQTTDGADARGSRTVLPDGDDACFVVLELVVQPHGSERLLRSLLARMLRRNLRGDLRRLASLVEAGELTAPCGPAARAA